MIILVQDFTQLILQLEKGINGLRFLSPYAIKSKLTKVHFFQVVRFQPKEKKEFGSFTKVYLYIESKREKKGVMESSSIIKESCKASCLPEQSP